MPTNLAQPLLGPFRQGARNDGVRAVQERLNEVLAGSAGFVRLATDGAFGGRTAAAVLAFQKSHRLRPDGVVGPITAKALGFTQYTSLQRLGTGALQLASAVGGSLARLVPSAHAEPDPAYDILMALVVQANTLRMLAAGIPAAAVAGVELDRIVETLKRQLENMRNQAFMVTAAKGIADTVGVQMRLMSISGQMQAFARQMASQPGMAAQSPLLDFLALQSQMLAMHAAALVGLHNMTLHRQMQAANEVLQIAAKVANGAKRLVPHL